MFPASYYYLDFINQWCIRFSSTEEGENLKYPQYYGLLDFEGNVLHSQKFKQIEGYPYTYPNCKVRLYSDDEIIDLDSSGKNIIAKEWIDLNGRDKSEGEKHGWWKLNKWFINPNYDRVDEFQHNMFYKGYKNEKVDIFDSTGKLIKQTTFSDVKSFAVGNFKPLCFIGTLSNKNYLLDKNFMIISKAFDYIEPSPLVFNNSQCIFYFTINDKYGIMDEKGKIIYSPMLTRVPSCFGNVITIPMANEKFDLIDLSGKLLMKEVEYLQLIDSRINQYFISKDGKSGIYSFNPFKTIVSPDVYSLEIGLDSLENSLYFLQRDGLKGIINASGKIIVPVEYEEFIYIGNEIFALKKNGICYLVNPNYSLKKTSNTFSSLNFYDGKIVGQMANGKYVLIDNDGKILSNEYDYISFEYFSLGHGKIGFQVNNNLHNGLIDVNGKELISCGWDQVIHRSYDDVRAYEYIVTHDNKFCLLDSNFKQLPGFLVDSLTEIENGSFIVKIGSKWHVSNKELKIEQESYDKILECRSQFNLPYFSCMVQGKWGLRNVQGSEWKFKPVYDNPISVNESNETLILFRYKLDGKCGMMDESGKLVLTFDADYFQDMVDWNWAEWNKDIKGYKINKGGHISSHTLEIEGGTWGLANDKGKTLYKPTATYIQDLHYNIGNFSNNTFQRFMGTLVNEGGSITEYTCTSVEIEMIDPNGIPVLIKDDLKNKRISKGKWGIINALGKTIVPVKYDDIKISWTKFDHYSRQPIGYRYASLNDSVDFFFGVNIALNPILVKMKNKWGAYDFTGKLIIPIEFDSISDSSMDPNMWISNSKLIRVWKNGKFGYFDFYGKNILPVEFNFERKLSLLKHQKDYPFFSELENENLILFQKGGASNKYSFEVKERPYQVLIPYEGLVVDSVDANGQMVLQTETIRLEQLSEGVFGLYDPLKQTWVVAPEYEDIKFNGYKNKYVDFSHPSLLETKKPVSPTEKINYTPYDAIGSTDFIQFKKKGKWGVMQLGKGELIPPANDSSQIFLTETDTLLKVFNGNLFGLYDKFGKQVLPIEYSHFEPYKTPVNNYNNKPIMFVQKGGVATHYNYSVLEKPYFRVNSLDYGYEYYRIDSIDLKGKLVMRPEIVAQVCLTGGTYGIYDPAKLQWILPPVYEDLKYPGYWNYYYDQYHPENFGLNKIRSITGKLNYTPVNFINQADYIQIKQNGKWGIFQLKNGVLLVPAFDSLKTDFSNGDTLILAYSLGKVGMYDNKGKEFFPPIVSAIFPIDHANVSEEVKQVPTQLVQVGGNKTNYKLIYKGSPFMKIDEGGWPIDSVDVSGQPVYSTDTSILSYFSNAKFGLYDNIHRQWILQPEYDELILPRNALPNNDYVSRYTSTNKKSLFAYDPLNIAFHLSFLCRKQGKFYSYDWNAKTFTDLNVDSIQIVDLNVNPGQTKFYTYKNGKQGILDYDLQEKMAPLYDNVIVSGDLFLVNNNGKKTSTTAELNSLFPKSIMIDDWGTIQVMLDEKGNAIYDKENTTWEWIQGGEFSFYNKATNKQLFEPTKEKLLIPIDRGGTDPLDYVSLGDSTTFARISKLDVNKTVWMISKAKAIVYSLISDSIPSQVFDEATYIEKTKAFKVKRNGKYGIVMANGSFTTDCLYDEIVLGDGVFYKAKKADSIFFILPHGEILNELNPLQVGPLIYDFYKYLDAMGTAHYYRIESGNEIFDFEEPVQAYEELLQFHK